MYGVNESKIIEGRKIVKLGKKEQGISLFMKEALKNFHTTAAIIPSSRYLTHAMLKPLSLERAKTVVELGSGTGAMTREILRLMPEDSRLFGFEINPVFIAYLKKCIPDKRFQVINNSAVEFKSELERLSIDSVDAVASSLGMGYMSDEERCAILRDIALLLKKEGVFTQFQYFHGLQYREGRFTRFNVLDLFNAYFNSVSRNVIWCNLPPAFVYTVRK